MGSAVVSGSLTFPMSFEIQRFMLVLFLIQEETGKTCVAIRMEYGIRGLEY